MRTLINFLIYVEYFFFFQAEDGIRDLTVTGVQTCALPICKVQVSAEPFDDEVLFVVRDTGMGVSSKQLPHVLDRKSTRLNSSHSQISYAVFCLKKKNKIKIRIETPSSYIGYPNPNTNTLLY